MSEALHDGKMVNSVPAQPSTHPQKRQKEHIQREVPILKKRGMTGVQLLLLFDFVLLVGSSVIMAFVTGFGLDYLNFDFYRYRVLPVAVAFIVPTLFGTVLHKWQWIRERFFWLHATIEAVAIVGPFIALFIVSQYVLPTKGLHVINSGTVIEIYKGAIRVNPLVHHVITFTGFNLVHQMQCSGIHEGETSYWIVSLQTEYVGSYDKTADLFWRYRTSVGLREAAKKVIRDALDSAIGGAACEKLKTREFRYDMTYVDTDDLLKNLGYTIPYGISLKLLIKKKPAIRTQGEIIVTSEDGT